MDERRRKARYMTEGFFLVHDALSGEIVGQIMNMSVTGLMVMTDETWPHDDLRQCVIRLPEKLKSRDEIEFEAVSVWCEPDPASTMYCTGFQIRKLTPENQAVVEELLTTWKPAPYLTMTK